MKECIGNYKVSVIVPIYNVERFLKKCIESILNQTHRNLEVILVNDASPDNCEKICQDFAEKDNRIIVIQNESNRGLSAARNSGLDIATGDFIGFVDGDDWIEADMYECLIKNLIEYEADISQCNFYFEYKEGQSLSKAYKSNKINVCDRESALSEYFSGILLYYSVWSTLFDRKVIGNLRFNEKYKRAEDMPFKYYIIKKATKVVTTNIGKYHYVRHSESIMSKYTENFFDNVAVAHLLLTEEGKESKYRTKLLRNYIQLTLDSVGYIQKNNMFKENYHLLRRDLLKYKNEIMQNKDLSKKLKCKILLLKYCPLLYNIRVRVMPYYKVN